VSVSRETVLHVAELASLSLDDAEVDGLAKDLHAIVEYVEQLGAVNTEGVEPYTHSAAETTLRKDVVIAGLTREEALANAPRATEEGFAVPRFVHE
jgi:aspartyl-tRNA(Asn)/glutamyl-tRNA(Gln) amidotransferase subunit C